MELVKHETCQQYVDRRLSEGWKIVSQKGYHLILSSPDGNILRPVDLQNDVETLRPDAPGDETNIEAQVPDSNSHWQKVDEVVADDSSTYVKNWTGPYQRDLYNLPAPTGEGPINFIKIYFRILSSGTSPSYCKPSLKSDTTVTDGTQVTRSSGVPFATYSQQWNTNPAPPGTDAWTWPDIRALQIGVSIKGVYPDSACGCTQVYVEVDYTPPVVLPTAIALLPTLSAQKNLFRTLSTTIGLEPSLDGEASATEFLCVASSPGGSMKTKTGDTWTVCAKTAAGGLSGSYFAQYLNRLCVLDYERQGFSYSGEHDIESNWTNKPAFPNLPQRFTELFVGRDAGDDPVLNFLTPIGMYYLDVFTNFVFGPTELTWEEDDSAGKKGLYWKGEHYVAIGKGIYKISRGEVTLVGPDMDDGVPQNLQGVITDMIGVGFWLVIAIDGGASKKSCIMKRYITGKHWHPVYVGSLDTPIQALCWDSGTLYFGEGTDVKSLPFPNVTDNVKQLTDHDYCATGEIIYPYFHSIFEAMPKVAHKVWAVTQDCNSDEKITISYRVDEETGWTPLGSFTASPRPPALPFPAAGDSIGVAFERIQFKAAFARGVADTTKSPKLESLILEYRVTPPVLWGWDVQVNARTTKERRGQDIINAMIEAIEKNTLLSFYPSGDKSGTEYFVEVKGMPGLKKGTEFGEEGLYQISLQEVVE